MALFLNEAEVAGLLPMGECIDALERAFANAGAGRTDNKARSRIRMPGGFFHFMAAADGGAGVFGYKAYPSFGGPAGAKMMVMLYDYQSGELLACMEGSRLGQIRTGAASGLATRYMARPDAATVAIIGSGFQAADATGGGLRGASGQGSPRVQPPPGTPRGFRPAQRRKAGGSGASGGQRRGMR